jgi:hypothetical protein
MCAAAPAAARAVSASRAGAIARAAGGAQVQFLRTRPLSLDADRPDVTLIARDIDALDPGRLLFLVGAARPRRRRAAGLGVGSDARPVRRAGRPDPDAAAGRAPAPFFVAGVWRDYANQSGSIVVRLADYRADRRTRSDRCRDLGRRPGGPDDRIARALRKLPFGAALQLASPGEIRAMSLQIFDRSFAVTYLLEAIAIAIGLSGVAATFSAQTLARAREFGMLRHVGVTRGQVLRHPRLRRRLADVLGVACGFVLGLVISLILVFVVNPQSFHWTMQPAPALGAAGQRGRGAGGGLGRHRAGVGTLCAVGRAGARRQGGLVMRLVLRFPCAAAVYYGAWRWPRRRPSRRSRPAAAGLPARLRRPSRLSHRVVVRHRLADDPAGKPLGFQVTFFRSRTEHDPANPSAFAPHQLIIGHAACPTPASGAWCTTSAARAKASAWPGPNRATPT